jgi:AcrR family transcriptional regulator
MIMPPQINFSQKQILQVAFELVRKEGLKALSARRIAQELKCSTHPIYRAFQSMQKLEEAVIEKIKAYAIEYLLQGDAVEKPFLNIGLQYFHFAQKEPEFFTLLFLEGHMKTSPEQIGLPFLPMLTRMQQDPYLQGLSEESLTRIGRDMWIFTHGLITLLHGIELEHAEEFVRDSLLKMGQTIIEWEHLQRIKADISDWPQLEDASCSKPECQ